MELLIRKHIDRYYKLSDVEKIFGADVQKTTNSAIIMAPKEVIYRKRQNIGFPYIIHARIILFNQMVKERTSIMTGAEEVSFSLKLLLNVKYSCYRTGVTHFLISLKSDCE